MKKIKYVKEHRRFGMLVATYRKQRGLTQEQLANSLDIDGQQISRIERGVVGFSLDRICDIAKALDIPPYMLLEFDKVLDKYKD